MSTAIPGTKARQRTGFVGQLSAYAFSASAAKDAANAMLRVQESGDIAGPSGRSLNAAIIPAGLRVRDNAASCTSQDPLQ